MRVRVVENPDVLADLAAASVARYLREADGHVTLGLAGGGTPRVTYTRLRDEDVVWERVSAWLSDERWVDPSHPDRNAGMAGRALFDHVPATLHELGYAGLEPAAAARAYEHTLADLFAADGGGGRPDLVLLGVGADGHTASLFSGTAALEERDRLFVENWVPQLNAWRLTATLPLLQSARRLVFLVSGESKAEVMAQILEGEAPHPARLAAAGAEDVVWFLDLEAASHLTDIPRELV